MSKIKIGQTYIPKDFYIKSPDGKHKLTFPTEISSQHAQVFMDYIMQYGQERGKKYLSTMISGLAEELQAHILDCQELLNQLRLSQKTKEKNDKKLSITVDD